MKPVLQTSRISPTSPHLSSPTKIDPRNPFDHLIELLSKNVPNLATVFKTYSEEDRRCIENCLNPPYVDCSEPDMSEQAVELVTWCAKLCDQCKRPDLISQVLAKALNSWRITKLDCSNNKSIGKTGVQLIAMVLTQGDGVPSLNELCLEGCGLGNDDNVNDIIGLISHKPSHQPFLQSLSLLQNDFDPVSEKKIRDEWEKAHAASGGVVNGLFLDSEIVIPVSAADIKNIPVNLESRITAKRISNFEQTLLTLIQKGTFDRPVFDDLIIELVIYFICFIPDSLHGLNKVLEDQNVMKLTICKRRIDIDIKILAGWMKTNPPISTLRLERFDHKCDLALTFAREVTQSTRLERLEIEEVNDRKSPWDPMLNSYLPEDFVDQLRKNVVLKDFYVSGACSKNGVRPWFGDKEKSAFIVEELLLSNRKNTPARTEAVNYLLPDIVNLHAQEIVSAPQSTTPNPEKIPQDDQSILAQICHLDKQNDPEKIAAFNQALLESKKTALSFSLGEGSEFPLHIARWLATNPCISTLKFEVLHYDKSIASALCDALKKNTQLHHLEMLWLGRKLYSNQYLYVDKYIEMMTYNFTLTTVKVDREAYFEELYARERKLKWREGQQIRLEYEKK